MNRITKDTPIGTRVIVVTNGSLRRGQFMRWSDVSDNVARVALDKNFVAEGFHVRNVYLDTPAEGTWAWACEQALAGRATVRDHERVRLEFTNDALSLYIWCHNGWDSATIGRDDATATDWEIAK